MIKYNELPVCPVQKCLSFISDKWKILIIRDLLTGTKRFNELKKSLSPVTQKMLTQQLREMEEDGLIKRKVYPVVPPKVEYSLTSLGRSLTPVINAMKEWGEKLEINFKELSLELNDNEWPLEYIDHDRKIARAIVYDDNNNFYFVRVVRNDDFGEATLIETSGGGVEKDEDLLTAIKRELKEELGASVEVICKIGVVSDYYNLIHRHNINNYFLCKVKSFGDKNLTNDEKNCFHLSTLKLSYQEAINEYEARKNTKLGRLIANRELPILKYANQIINNQ